MPSARQRIIYTPWTVGLQASWTVAGVRAALSSHEQGNFTNSSQLIDGMGRDPRLNPVTETRLKGLFGSDFRVDPVDGEDSDAQATLMATELQADWMDMYPEADLMRLWFWRLYAGVGFGEHMWQRKATRWTPRLRVWHPQYIYADEEEQVYQLQTREGQVSIPFGGDDGKWIVLGRGDRPWMDGLVRSLAVPWLGAQFAFRDWVRYSERHGMPIVTAGVPAIADDDDRDAFFDDIRALSTETTVQLPTALDGNEGKVNFELGLVEASADTWQGFEGLLKQIYDSMAIALTGNNLTTLIEGGSFAASKEASERLRAFTEADGEELSTQLRQQSVRWWSLYNFEGGEERAPWPRWDTEPPEDLEQRATSMKLAGEALGALKNAGWEPEDMEAFGEQFNCKLVPIEEQEPEEQNPAMTPPEDDDDGPEDEPDDEALSRKVRKRRRTIALASGDDPANAQGFIDGQLFVDDLADDGVMRSTGKVDLKVVVDIIQSSQGYPDLRVRLREAFPGMDPRPMATLLQKALVIAGLAGRHAAMVDV